jgi:hypothetical protein
MNNANIRGRFLRWMTALALLGAAAAQAQVPASTPMPVLAVFSLLGEDVEVVVGAGSVGTRLNANEHETKAIQGAGFDRAVLRAVRDVLAAVRPATQMQPFAASTPMSNAAQRKIVADAADGGLPAWMVEQVASHKASHVLIATRGRGEADFRTRDGVSLGRGAIEGVGLYLDNDREVITPGGITARGFLGPFAYIRLTLMDAQTAAIVATHDVRASLAVGPHAGNKSLHPWDNLDAVQKIETLRKMIDDNVKRVMPPMLGR